MLKSIGALHNVPAPSAAVLGESLKLLATFGDQKSIGPLLEQMRDVQAQNEQVFREAQEAISELTVMRKELDDSRKAFATTKVDVELDIKRRQEELSQAEARMSGKAAKLTNEQEAIRSVLADRESNLANIERTLIGRESKCADKERDLESRLSVISSKESVLRDREQQLLSKEKKLRDALDGG